MSDTAQLPNTLYALLLLWGVALPALRHGMDVAMTRERRNWPEVFGSFALGVGLAYAGLAVTGLVTPELGKEIAKWLRSIASNPRWALLVWFLVLCWLTGPRFVERTLGASLNALRLMDEDARRMDQRIWYWEVALNGTPQLISPVPYVDFHLNFINASVFEATWAGIEGRIRVDGQLLQEPLITRIDDAG